jgi:hypothetical protein
MKRENLKWAIASVMLAFGVGLFIGYVYAYPVEQVKSYKNVGGNIDIEYYLEVSEDSIWVEGVQSKKVYSGKYSDLDSLINADNL